MFRVTLLVDPIALRTESNHLLNPLVVSGNLYEDEERGSGCS